MKMKISGKNFMVTVFGMGLAVASIATVLGTARGILMSIGLGIMLGGIFAEIGSRKEKK